VCLTTRAVRLRLDVRIRQDSRDSKGVIRLCRIDSNGSLAPFASGLLGLCQAVKFPQHERVRISPTLFPILHRASRSREARAECRGVFVE
jgi:hypothetical protein